VAEVDSGFQQLPHRDGWHGERPPGWFVLREPLVRPGTGPGSGTTPVGTARV
jgi:hypothetical protein